MRPTSRLLAVTLLLSLLSAPARAQGGPQLTQSAVAGGGGVSAQGPLRVEGTVGQPAAGAASGGAFTLAGGFQPVVAALAQPALSISDVTLAEGNAGTTAFTFAVTLDSPAGAGGVTFNYATADGTAAAADNDYEPAAGPAAIPEGQSSAEITVQVNGDAAQEPPSETFTVSVSNVAGASVLDGTGQGTILNDDGAPSLGQIIISEFRQRGPVPAGAPAAGNEQGQLDEFVELYNNTDSDIVVADSAPASAAANGWAIVSSDAPGKAKYVIPAGTTIPARGHFLVTNALGYSLSAYAPADTVADPSAGPVPASYDADIPDGAGVAVLRTGGVQTATPADRLDSVGFAAGPAASQPDATAPLAFAPNGFAEAAPLAPGGGVSTPAEHSHVRKLAAGRPQDSDDNFADFVLVATDMGPVDGAPAALGAPGPQNSHSPAQSNNKIKASLIDPAASSGESPNSVRRQCPPSPQADPQVEECDPSRSQFGTFSIRRRWTNTTGAGVTQLRFRIVGITAGATPPAGTADLRAISSVQVTGVSLTNVVAPGATITLEGTTLESPSSASLGGGFNSTLAAGTITSAQPLSPGASINLQFLLGVQQPGGYRFFLNVEALADGPPPASRSKAGATQPKAVKGIK